MLTLSFTWWRQNGKIVSQYEVICKTHCNFSLIWGETKLSTVEQFFAIATHIEAMTSMLRWFLDNVPMNFLMIVVKVNINQYFTSQCDTHGSWCDVSWVKTDGLGFCWFWYHRSGNHQVWGKSGLRIFHDFSENLQTQLSPKNPSGELSVFNQLLLRCEQVRRARG